MKNLDPQAQAIINEEEKLLLKIETAVADLVKPKIDAPDYNEALISLRDQMAEAKPEDLPALVEQMTRVAALAQGYGKSVDLPIDPNTPYFAHIQLEENQKSRDIMIGKRGYIDRKNRIQIVDWRNAPISRIYYRYEEGEDYEEEFGERIVEGVVKARRALTIQESRLQRIGCPQGTFSYDEKEGWIQASSVAYSELKGGQGKASRLPAKLRQGHKKSALGIHSGRKIRADKHLPEIAALIDPQQFELITHPQSGLVVLQGGAGTGKTTVALHRVAYLNFQQPQRFRADKMLVIVPSRALVSYVQRVLPALGVKGVRVLTASQWFERTRAKIMPRLSKAKYSDDTPSIVMRFKKHPLMLELLKRYVQSQEKSFTKDLEEKLKPIEGGNELLRVWDKDEKKPLIPRLLSLRGYARQNQISALLKNATETISTRLLKEASDFPNDWSSALTNRELIEECIQEFARDSFNESQINTIVNWCSKQSTLTHHEEEKEEDIEYITTADGRRERADNMPERGRLDRPDDALLLFLCVLKRGEIRSPSTSALNYEHLVVDEAQDLATVELKTLLEATSQARCITFAGDTAQRLVFDNAFTNWEDLLQRLGEKADTQSTLELGYRSTGEVMAFAKSLLANHAEDLSLPTRSGAPVELHQFDEQGEAIAMLANSLRSLMSREPLSSVALIAKHPAQAKLYADALERADVPGLRLVAHHDFSFAPGIEVTDIAQVKGLEFDYVIILDVGAQHFPNTVESRHLMHIAATRAAHQLWLISIGKPSMILPPL